ncbi:MAG: hypothetical protein ABR521_08020 [Gaiellaceae bacterium]
MTTRVRPAGLLPGVVAGLTLFLALGAPGARGYHTNFQGSCHNDYNNLSGGVSRSQSRAYAEVARYEGYQWGGGCWNQNNRDDAPNDPTQDVNTRGEGGDCSGFTFKAWAERQNTSDAGWTYQYPLRNVHGPYTAAAFKSGSGAPNVTIAKSNAITADAFASSSHIGMVYQARTAYNTDLIAEARCEACGTGIWSRTFRGDANYGAARRIGWSG